VKYKEGQMNLMQINDAYSQYLRPQTYPLAIRMCTSDSELPGKVRLPMRDLGINISLCHAIAMARRYGWVIAIDKTVSCYVPAISLGFVQIPPDIADGSFQASIGLWGMSKEEAAAAIRNMNKFDYGKYKYALIAPLDRAAFEPHVIVQYASPAQIWVLLSAYLTAIGRSGLDIRLTSGAGCTTYITKAMQTDEAQFVLVGTGERLVPHPQDFECAFSIPFSKIERTIKALETNYRTGVFRYPIPTFMRYSSQHPPGYDKMRSHLLGEGKE
jgi:uncharacterized protein (DUF169 family)